MNLLDKTEINLHDEKNIETIKRKHVINKNDDNKKNIKIDINKNNIYKNLIISFLIIFSLFLALVIFKKTDHFLNNDYSFITLMNFVLESNDFTIQSLKLKNNKMLSIINSNKEENIYNNLFFFEDLYKNIKFNINDNNNQIWVQKNNVITKNADINNLFNVISDIDNLSIELEIINNNLIAVGSLDDFKKIFSYLKHVNYSSFHFDLSLIEYNSEKTYYRLIIE